MDTKALEGLPDELKQAFDKEVDVNKDGLIRALFDLARGVWREETKTLANGIEIVRIYQEKPDKEVAQYLLNRVLGKPRETVSIQGRVNFIMDA